MAGLGRRWGVLGLALGAWACGTPETCREAAPSLTIEVGVEAGIDPAEITRLEVYLQAGTTWSRSYPIQGELADGRTSFSVLLEPAPTEAFDVRLHVDAFAETRLVSAGTVNARATPDACNTLAIVLGRPLQYPDAGVPDAAPADADGGVPDPDAGDADDGAVPDAGPPALVVSPNRFQDRWLVRQGPVAFVSQVGRSDRRPLADLAVDCPSGLTCTLEGRPEDVVRALRIELDTGAIVASSTVQAQVGLQSVGPPLVGGQIDLELRIVDSIQVGLSPESCPHRDPSTGATDTGCDSVGPALTEVGDQRATLSGPVHVVLHGDPLGLPATYEGPIRLIAETHLSAAEGLNHEDVIIACGLPSLPTDAAVFLDGDGAWVERLTVQSRGSCRVGVLALDNYAMPTAGTGGHLLEKLFFWASRPERLGANSIQEPFSIGPNTVVRNNWIAGFWETSFKLGLASGSSILHNTIVSYQATKAADLSGAGNLRISNNVIVGLGNAPPTLFVGSAQTSGLHLSGNLIEGQTALISGLDPSDTSNEISDNTLGPVALEAPSRPIFMADATRPPVDRSAPITGQSLDGQALDPADLWPGAFQRRSAKVGPRSLLVRVGGPDCGPDPCDLSSAVDNEVQQAVWLSWPGGTVEIFPSTVPYAGNAVISWPITVQGMGESAAEVVLRSSDEDLRLRDGGLWSAHQSLITLLWSSDAPSTLRNLSLSLEANSEAHRHAVFAERVNQGRNHVLERLQILAAAISNQDPALVLGEGVRVQDVEIRGPFGSCIRFGQPQAMMIAPAQGTVVNLTCRLTGTGLFAPVAGFEVAAMSRGTFLNVALEFLSGAPIFRAQVDARGTAVAPSVLQLATSSVQGQSGLYAGFSDVDGSYDLSFEEVPPGEEIFVGPNDSHLQPGSSLIDSGQDPSLVDGTLSPGTSVDGVSRTGRQLDRGAFEQGM